MVLTSKSHLWKLISCFLLSTKKAKFRGLGMKPHLLVKKSQNVLCNLYRAVSIMSIPILSFFIQVSIFGHSSLQSSYLLIHMVQWSICNNLGNLLYLLFNLWGRNSGSFKIFPCNILTGRWVGFIPTLFNVIQLIP